MQGYIVGWRNSLEAEPINKGMELQLSRQNLVVIGRVLFGISNLFSYSRPISCNRSSVMKY